MPTNDWSDAVQVSLSQNGTTSGFRLLPGEVAHIAYKNVTASPVDRQKIAVYSFVVSGENDQVPIAVARVRSTTLRASLSVRDVYGFVVTLTNDAVTPTQTVSGVISVRRDKVNLTSGLTAS